jgi:hypothetical protein
MRANRKKNEQPKFLSGWKEVAAYLGKGVRTVQRYERNMSFPVRRPAGKPRGAVIANRAELDAWVAASPIRHEFHLAKSANGRVSSAPSVLSAVKEMKTLREQMYSLRQELRSSIVALRNSIDALEGAAANHSWDSERRAAAMFDATFRRDRLYQMLASYPGDRKLN